MMKKVVLIADIVSSRQTDDRKVLQLNLENVLLELNNKNHFLISPYTITLGDEFQAVFSNSESIFLDAIEILVRLSPTKIRFSYGIGEISTNINEKTSIGMDGPAFYLARDGVEELKKNSYLFAIKGITARDSRLISESLYVFSQQMTKWNRNRLKILHLLMCDVPVKKIAKSLKISEQAVYKNISTGMLELFKNQLVEIGKIINEEIT